MKFLDNNAPTFFFGVGMLLALGLVLVDLKKK